MKGLKKKEILKKKMLSTRSLKRNKRIFLYSKRNSKIILKYYKLQETDARREVSYLDKSSYVFGMTDFTNDLYHYMGDLYELICLTDDTPT